MQGRGHSMMPEQRNQNNDGDGNPKQPEQRSSSESHDDLLYSGRRKLACHQIVPRGTHSLRIWPRKPDIGSSAGQGGPLCRLHGAGSKFPARAQKFPANSLLDCTENSSARSWKRSSFQTPILAMCAGFRANSQQAGHFFPAPRASAAALTSPATPPAAPAAQPRTPAAGRSSRDAPPLGSRHAASPARSGS